MMGSSKHLKQLLNEDQDPFVLSTYIHDKLSQLHQPIQLKPRNPFPHNSIFSPNLCKNACFFAFRQSPHLTKSPLFEFSPKPKASNTLFFRIPVETAALLLEAALRIENKPKHQKTKTKTKNVGFGFWGTILKRIRRRKRSEVEKSGGVKDEEASASGVCGNVSERREEVETSLGVEEKRSSDVGLSCSCNSRVSSAWTESNEEKSLETSTSRSEASEETECVVEEHSRNGEFDLCEKGSPFRFSLQNGCCRSPEFISPATSPNRRKIQVVKQNEEEQISPEGKEQKEEKEYFSPVSVLDLQVEDDVEIQDEDENDHEDENDTEYERSFAFVQKAKLKLLKKLLRFERLAQLDPLELEKRITEDENGYEEEEDDDDEEEGNEEGVHSVLQNNGDYRVIVREVLKGSSCSNHRRIPFNTKRLDRDLMGSEGAVTLSSDRVFVANKLCRRLGSLKDRERSTINTMVEIDFRGAQNEWRKNGEEVEETVVAVEYAIFGFLMEELSVEIFHSDDLY